MALFGKKKNTENNKKFDKLELISGIIDKLGLISDINVNNHTMENNTTNKQLEEICSKVNYCIKQIEAEENSSNIVSLLNDINFVLHNTLNNIPFRDESLQYALIAKDQLEFYIVNKIQNDKDIEDKIDIIVEHMTNLKTGLNNSITLCKDSIDKSDIDTKVKIENKIKRYELHINIIDKYIETSKRNSSSKIEANMIDKKVINKTEESKKNKDCSIVVNDIVDIKDKDLEKYKQKLKIEIDNELKLYKEKAQEEINKQKEQAEQDILKYKRDLRKKFDNEIIQYGSEEQKRIKGVLNDNNDISVEELIEGKGNTLTEEKQKEEIKQLKEELDILLYSNEEYKVKEQTYLKKIENLNSEIEDIKSNNEENINQKLLEKTEEINTLTEKIENITKEKELVYTEKTNSENKVINLTDKLEKLEENISVFEEEICKNNSEIKELTIIIENKEKEISELKQENTVNLSTINSLQENEKKYIDTIENLENRIQNENESGKTKYLLELEDIKLKMSKENNELQEIIDKRNEELEELNLLIEEANKKNEELLNGENNYKDNIKSLENELFELNEELEQTKNELKSKLMILESKDSVIEELETTLVNSDKTEVINNLEKEIAILKEKESEIESITQSRINELNNTISDITKEKSDLINKIDSMKGQTIILPNVLMINPYLNNIRHLDEPKKRNSLFALKKNNGEIEKEELKEFALQEYDYEPEFIEKDKESLILVSKCNKLEDISLFTDKKGYYVGFSKDFDGKKYNNSNCTLVKINKFDETDVEFFINPIDEKVLENISKEKLVSKLSTYYQFIIWYYNKNIANSNLNINDLIEFKKYYNELIKTVYPIVENDYKVCTDLLINANKKILLLKLFGIYYENENELIGEYINNEINNNNNSKINTDINNIMRIDIVLPEVIEFINNSLSNKKTKSNIDINSSKNIVIEDEDLTNNNTQYQSITNNYNYSQEPKITKPLTIAEKIDNVNVINFNNIKYVVKKQNSTGLVDVSGYSIENIDVAINQYVYMEAYYKELGIKYNDELIFLFGKNNNTKSAPILDDRAKHINKWDRGVMGEIISYYENKLGKIIEDYER